MKNETILWVLSGVVVFLILVFVATINGFSLPGVFVLTAGLLALAGLTFWAKNYAVNWRQAKLNEDRSEWEDDHKRPPRKGTPEAAVLNFRIAILNYCIENLKQRVEEDEKEEWRWRAKLKVAQLVSVELSRRITWKPETSLTDGEMAAILAEHPFLKLEDGLPADLTKQEAHERWCRDMRRKVQQFEKSIARSDIPSADAQESDKK